MSKSKILRTEPISLNESTLETNIVGEISSLFNSPFNFGYPSRLRYLFEFERINFNAFRKRKAKLYRLTPIEENRGGGWDTKITIPTSKNNARAIFIQFKSGNHKDGNNINGSLFNYSEANPNPHAEFSFNDNSNNNQHQTLKDLADHLTKKGLSEKSVMYGFPRITKLQDFDNLQEDLLLHTSFLTITEIDSEAKKAKANLYDGQKHHFRTCYIDERKREISSKTFQFEGNDNSENVLYEIILVKLAQLRNGFDRYYPRNYDNYDLFLLLAQYLGINPSNIIDLDRDYSPDIRRYFEELVTSRKKDLNFLFERKDIDTNPFSWREILFRRVVKYFSEIPYGPINISSDIPSQYTFNLPNQEPIDFTLKSNSDITLLTF